MDFGMGGRRVKDKPVGVMFVMFGSLGNPFT